MSTSSKAGSKAKSPEWNNPSAVDEYLAKLDHCLKPTLEAIRNAVLSADPRITEGIKWNAPSFYCNGWFATANVRGKDAAMVVFHMGAKVKDNSTAGGGIEDETGLLEWIAKERALARFRSLENFDGNKEAFKSVVRQWVRKMRAI